MGIYRPRVGGKNRKLAPQSVKDHCRLAFLRFRAIPEEALDPVSFVTKFVVLRLVSLVHAPPRQHGFDRRRNQIVPEASRLELKLGDNPIDRVRRRRKSKPVRCILAPLVGKKINPGNAGRRRTHEMPRKPGPVGLGIGLVMVIIGASGQKSGRQHRQKKYFKSSGHFFCPFLTII